MGIQRARKLTVWRYSKTNYGTIIERTRLKLASAVLSTQLKSPRNFQSLGLSPDMSLQPRSSATPENKSPQWIRQLAESYTVAWCSQEPAKVASFYEEDGSLAVNSDPPAIGREAISNVARGFMTAFPDMRVVNDDLEINDDGAIYHWTLTGTNSGPGGTGRSVNISGYEEWRLGPNGLIATSQGHFDSADYQHQLGL